MKANSVDGVPKTPTDGELKQIDTNVETKNDCAEIPTHIRAQSSTPEHR